MKPSEVFLWRGLFPLIDTFGHAESELAAALMVRACVRNGDKFQALTPQMIGESLQADIAEEEPWKTLARCPFVPHPDVRELAANGFAEFDGDPDVKGTPIRFTQAGLDILERAR